MVRATHSFSAQRKTQKASCGKMWDKSGISTPVLEGLLVLTVRFLNRLKQVSL